MKQVRIYLFLYSIILFLFINSHSLSALECDAPCYIIRAENGVENCGAVKQYSGTNPSNEELISIIEQAGKNQLADRGPHLPQMGSGCPENIRSPNRPCPPFNKNHPPFVPPYLLRIIGYVESGCKHFYYDEADKNWKTVTSKISPDCGYGLMQITSSMCCNA